MNREKYLWDNMNTKLREYVEKGYIKRLSQSEKETYHPTKWYLPIFPVFNPNKPNKLRIVWDAAAKFKGVSLNSALFTGPDLPSPLPNILFRFREYKIAIAQDISEMYHQVCMNSTDQQSQRFLWCWSPDQEPQEYIMRRMTFGASCSPSCAQYVKNTNAERFSDKFPLAVICIKEDHYVDDFLTSVETDSEAVQLTKQVKYIHMKGGFALHNCMSNSKEVLDIVGSSTCESKDLSLEATAVSHKILGMWWNLSTDTFQFKVPEALKAFLKEEIVPTKRQILSVLITVRSTRTNCWLFVLPKSNSA